MQDVAVDNSGKQNTMSVDGYWYFQIIICKKTSRTWVYFLFSTADSTKTFDAWLREVPCNVWSRQFAMTAAEVTLATKLLKSC